MALPPPLSPQRIFFRDGWDANVPDDFPTVGISDIRDALRLLLLEEGEQCATSFVPGATEPGTYMTTMHYRDSRYANAYWFFRNDEEAEVYDLEIFEEEPPPIEEPPPEN